MWENVWSCWTGITQGDGEAIRRAATVLRYFGSKQVRARPRLMTNSFARSHLHPLSQVGMLHSSRWQPHVPVVTSENDQRAVFVSKFPLRGEAVWFAINTGNTNRTATLNLTQPTGTKLYDCYRGVPVPSSYSPATPSASPPRPAPSPHSRARFTQWIKYGDNNCYDRHGARDLENPSGSAAPGSPMLLADCQKLCLATPGCTAVTVSSSDSQLMAGNGFLRDIAKSGARADTVQCYRRSEIQIQHCDHGRGYDTYSYGALPPSPAPVLPSPSPYNPPSPAPHPGGVNVTVTVPIEAYGIGCFVATRNGSSFDRWYQRQAGNGVHEPAHLPGGKRVRGQFTQAENDFADFMSTMHKLVSRGPNLACLDWEFKLLPQTLVAIPHSGIVQPSAPPGMVTVPGGDRGAPLYQFGSSGLEIEQGAGCDLQLPWEDSPRVQHNRTLNLTSFHIDKYPVTTEQYAQYLNESGYRPRDPTRW